MVTVALAICWMLTWIYQPQTIQDNQLQRWVGNAVRFSKITVHNVGVVGWAEQAQLDKARGDKRCVDVYVCIFILPCEKRQPSNCIFTGQFKQPCLWDIFKW